MEMTRGVLAAAVETACPPATRPTEWDLTALQTDVLSRLGLRVNPNDLAGMSAEQVEEELFQRALQRCTQRREELVGASLMREAERNIICSISSTISGKTTLLSMDTLEGRDRAAWLRAEADPLVEYKKESFDLFQNMLMDRIEDETVRYLYFLRFEMNSPALPFSNSDDEEDGDGSSALDEAEAERLRIQESQAAAEERRRAAQSVVQDMNRGLQKKHEKELKDLQFGAPDAGTASQTVSNGGPRKSRTQ